MQRILIIDKTAGLEASHERHQALARQPGVDLHVLGPRYWVESGRPIVWRPPEDTVYTVHPGLVFGKDYYARVGYYSGLCRAMALSNPDIIQLLEEPWSVVALQTVLAAAVFAPAAKIVFYTWENIYRPWIYPSRASLAYSWIDKILHVHSVAALCATEGAKSVLLNKNYTKPIAVVPYGIPGIFFDPPEKAEPVERPFTIGYVGRLLHMKGIDLLLQAVARLSDCRLILAGAGEDEAQYRTQARNLGIDDRVEWTGPMNERLVPHLLRRMDVFVMPSRHTAGWQEQLGRAAIEAMAVGTPVIGARSGAIPEVIGGAGVLFDENNVAELIEAIQRLQRDPGERMRLREAGRQRARRYYTWPRFAAGICSFYQNL